MTSNKNLYFQNKLLTYKFNFHELLYFKKHEKSNQKSYKSTKKKFEKYMSKFLLFFKASEVLKIK